MKLFEIRYLQDMDEGQYLIVGNDNDTEKTIEEKELNSERWKDKSCLYSFYATEIKEVDGHRILVVE